MAILAAQNRGALVGAVVTANFAIITAKIAAVITLPPHMI